MTGGKSLKRSWSAEDIERTLNKTKEKKDNKKLEEMFDV